MIKNLLAKRIIHDIWIINALKLILMIFVIIIHSNTNFNLGLNNNILFILFIQLAVPYFMVLSGNNMCIRMRDYNKLKDLYKYQNLSKSIIRYIVPIIITLAIYAVAMSIVASDRSDLIRNIILLDIGQGSYFLALCIQMVIIFPLIYNAYFKWGGVRSIIISAFVTIAFEIISTLLQFSPYVYSRCILRFVAFIAVGVCIYFTKTIRPKMILIVSGIIGIGWTIWSQLFDNYSSIIFFHDITYALPCLLWVWIPIYFLLKLDTYKPSSRVLFIITSIGGRASFHILCTQMIWFNFANRFFDIHFKNSYGFVLTVASLLVSIFFGIVFYFVDNYIQFCIRRIRMGEI